MAPKHRSPRQSGSPGASDVGHADAHAAMTSLGWIVPESERDVKQAEQALSATTEGLPQALRDAEAVFDGKAADGAERPSSAIPAADVRVDEGLARAAREGGTISSEIEARMRRDRRRAEEAADGQEPGSSGS